MNQLVFLFCIFTFSLYFGQNYEPLELAKIQMSKDYKKIKKFYGKNFEGPNGSQINDSVKLTFREIYRTNHYSVINATFSDNYSGKNLDTYFHFEKEKEWKITAFRALAMTGLLYAGLQELEKMSEEEIQEIINSSKIFNSKEDHMYFKENIKLSIGSDDEIIAHFIKNKTDFETLKKSIKQGKADELLAKKLYLSRNLNATEPICEKCIILPIGGILDNTVGYFFIENKKDLPEPDPSRIIMLREIESGWYLYKTT